MQSIHVTILTSFVLGITGDTITTIFNTETRIVGGVPVSIEKYPYHVSIFYRKGYICGGSLISSSWVLTAAHCFIKNETQHVRIRAGSDFVYKEGTVVRVSSVYRHPLYDIFDLDYDIAVLALSSPIPRSRTIGYGLLPKRNQKFAARTKAVVTGWGLTEEDGVRSITLQGVVLEIVSNSECQKRYNDVHITDRMLCAGDLYVGGKDACQSDSGGGLAIDGMIIGIVSFGVGCGRASHPGVYANVANLRSFIRSTTGV